jgi:transcriptional regulator with XRE-family HTH domain
LRKEQAVTLRELARRCNLSESYLSRIENHKSSIGIDTLNSVAMVLGVPITYFFERADTDRAVTVCRAGKGKPVRLGNSRGLLVKMLAAEKRAKLMEPFVVDLCSARDEPAQRTHSGDEFFYVIDGECILTYGKDTIRLAKGDSVYYDPRIPHMTVPVEGKGCMVLAVVASRSYLFHGDLSRLLQEVDD